MNKIITTLLILVIIITTSGNLFSTVIYLDPKPGAKYVSINNSIIIGLDQTINESHLNNISLNIRGTKSGVHTGRLLLSSDKKSIIFKPDNAFSASEEVKINVRSNLSQISYNSLRDFSISFTTEASRFTISSDKILRSELGEYFRAPMKLDIADPPQLTVQVYDTPSPGRFFISSFNQDPSYMLIANNDGSLYFNRSTGNQSVDFKKQEDGTLTYFDLGGAKFYQMDNGYNIIDSFACGNGYSTDLHELVILPNGHSLLMSYDPQVIDMSSIVMGGDPEAIVIGLIIQELDENKNVVFQWRSWDHFEITDTRFIDLTAKEVDYVHGNAIDMDTDGNLLISSRHLDEITKINRTTGDVMWRMGGSQNEFTFVNDSLGFYRQHCIRRIQNGNVILFDNGNYHKPSFSRAVEYTLDEDKKIATLVWEYRNNPSIYGFAMGSVQRLSNGNTVIGWGFTNPTLTEVNPNSDRVLEMNLPMAVVSYRAFKHEWDSANTSVQQINNEIAREYTLSQNYPNPFNPTTNINFSIPKSGLVNLKVYDIMGREIKELVNSNLQAGNYIVNFEGANLPSGVYMYKITTESFSDSKRMMLVK
jgi:hypothetical protein